MIAEHDEPNGSQGHTDFATEPESATLTVEPPRKILIVDDDPVQTEILEFCFRKVGFESSTASTGEEGLQKARDIRPDVVLLDIEMPGVCGLEVCRELTDDSVTLDIPIIIVSGCEDSDVVRSSRAAGCRFFVRKPYDPNALLTLVQAAMQGSGW